MKASEVTIHLASPFMVEFSYLVGIVAYMTLIYFTLRMCYNCAPKSERHQMDVSFAPEKTTKKKQK